MQKIKKCVIPAAGFGTRFLPATKALPKEMFPIIDKPVMQYLVEEAVEAGCEDIIIVTGRSKRAIEDHFDANFELETLLEKNGKTRRLEEIKKLNSIANISYIRQPYPRGDGDAILRTKNIIGEEPFLVLFGDDLIYDDIAASTQLIQAFGKVNSSIIGTINIKDEEVSSYGIIEKETSEQKDIFKIKNFLEKPNISETSSRNGSVGKYVLTHDVFDYLERVNLTKKEGEELRLADAFSMMLKNKDIYGYNLQGIRYDTGSKMGFLKAIVSMGLKREDLKDDFREFLVDVLKN